MELAASPSRIGGASEAGGAGSEIRFFESTSGHHLFVTDGSRIYDLSAEESAILKNTADPSDGAGRRDLLRNLGLSPAAKRRHIDATPIEPPKVTAFSINVAQACNMGCHYCYADEGKFGTRARLMPAEVAMASVDRLFAESDPSARLVLGFMGGEPLLARKLVHDTARYAWEKAARWRREIGFSLTTNATLLREADAELFSDLPFAVTFSIDGTPEVQRASRPMHNGGDSYQAVLDALAVIERVGRPRQLSARSTVTVRSGRLLPLLDHLIGLGFDDVGFSALLVSPTPGLAFDETDFKRHLDHMIECGEKAIAEIRAGRAYPFGNLETALQEIHRGAHRPLPCGAGAGYLSVNAEGALYACHRLIDDAAFAMGDVFNGSDVEARRRHLNRSHVDKMEPCKSCWARYLCGGGCHHEVKARGRLACDYIRGWLQFCLKAYVELSDGRGASGVEGIVNRPDARPSHQSFV
jgi:uncharacterized protein